MSAVVIRMGGLYRYDNYRDDIFVMGSRTGAYGTVRSHSGLKMDTSDVSLE
jgi:hypothetical protein